MFRLRKVKIIFLLVFLCAFCAIATVSIHRENHACMGVPILSREEYAKYGDYIAEDLSSYLYHNDQPAAVDTENAVIYISQKITGETAPGGLAGLLTIQKAGYTLSFAPDDAFDQLDSAVANGHRFQLLITTPESKAVSYDVIFTTLPLLRLEGSVVGVDDEGRDVLEGMVCLWAPLDPDTNKYSCKTSRVQWNSRGHSTSYFPKKSWKLTLQDKDGNNRDLSFLGMGADDDWILNSMVVDNVKMREMLTTTLWNELAAATGDHKMACMEYVEVVSNGRYCGVYFLQRRLDSKYLQLADNQVLLRGEAVYASSQEYLEQAYNAMEQIRLMTDYSTIVQTNWLDVNIFLELIQGFDNTGRNAFYNNIAYIVTFDPGNTAVRYLLWDTDMSYGIMLNAQGQFFYHKSYAAAYLEVAHRTERYNLRALYPDLTARQNSRWRELRGGILNEAHIYQLIDQFAAELDRSGAMTRETEKWGLHHEGDTVADLKEFISIRLATMDAIYLS